MKDIKVTPQAFESFGVRSMCTLIETSELSLLVDPGVSLGPRFGILPHPEEYRALGECRLKVAKAAETADVIVVSHYHNDHHTPSYRDTVWIGSSMEQAAGIVQGKDVLVKDIRSFINFSQRRRGWMFQKTSLKKAKSFQAADGEVFQYGETKLRFSRPVYHGEEASPLGWVLMHTVERGNCKVMYAPDVQGPILDETLKLILLEKPDLLIVGGPPTYLSGFKISEETLARALGNLKQLVQNVPTTILEHHLLRDEGWRDFAEPAFRAAEKAGSRILTAAEYVGKRNNLLECRRMKLYTEEPPNMEFQKWMKLPKEKRRLTQPPI